MLVSNMNDYGCQGKNCQGKNTHVENCNECGFYDFANICFDDCYCFGDIKHQKSSDKYWPDDEDWLHWLDDKPADLPVWIQD